MDASLGAPQVAPKDPKTYPGSSQEPSELSEGPPGPPGRPGSHETYGKSQKSKENHAKRIRTIQNQTEYHETFKSISDDRLHLHVTGHLPTKR